MSVRRPFAVRPVLSTVCFYIFLPFLPSPLVPPLSSSPSPALPFPPLPLLSSPPLTSRPHEIQLSLAVVRLAKIYLLRFYDPRITALFVHHW